MTDQKNPTIPNAEKEKISGNMPVKIRRQYVRDLSFENPNAPQILDTAGRPDMDINFSMQARPLESKEEGDLFEVVIWIQADAKRGDQVAFIAQVEYGVEVLLENVPNEVRHPLLYIEIPQYAFPYIRHLVSTLTQGGGYPPLLLAPVDFKAFYMQRFAKELENDSDPGLADTKQPTGTE